MEPDNKMLPPAVSDLLRDGALEEALGHANRAVDLAREGSIVDQADHFFRALNKLWNAFNLLQEGSADRGDIGLFGALLVAGLGPDDRRGLLDNAAVDRLARLEPPVLNHHKLNRARWRPGSSMSRKLRQDATEDHRRFKSALADRFRQGVESDEAALKKLATLLYVVRSNIAHGEKTPYGPDIEKRRRDEEVCACVVPLQELILNLLLQRADQKLVAYGTLAPGGSNHDCLRDVPGTWRPCVVRGRLSLHEGLQVFRWSPSGSEVRAMLLVSKTQPEHWSTLDRFEGQRYRRHLVPIRVEGIDIVGYVYEGATA